MSQLGMQMPGARRTRKATPNIYTALAFISVACLAAAVVFTAMAAMKVAPESGIMGALKVQEAGNIKLVD